MARAEIWEEEATVERTGGVDKIHFSTPLLRPRMSNVWNVLETRFH